MVSKPKAATDRNRRENKEIIRLTVDLSNARAPSAKQADHVSKSDVS